MDFDDIIMKTVELLRENDEVREYYCERFRYVCVDEYQDTNYAQFMLAYLLTSKRRNIMVVGDDDQSIYAFRGATVTNILEFDKAFPGAVTVKLEQNYRSTGNILGAANSIIANNDKRHGKQLWTEHGDGEKITLKKLDNQNEEARYIADCIMHRVDTEGRKLSDFAVLYRVNAQAQSIESAFARSGIAYRVLGGTRFYDRKEIKDVLAYLCLINNTDDNVRLKRIINEPKRGIGASTVNAVEDIAGSEHVSMFDVMERAECYTALSRSAVKLREFASMIRSFSAMRDSMCLSELFKNVIELSGYRDMLLSLGEAERDRLENVEELISSAVEYEQNNEEATLAGFLEDVALVSDVDSYDRESDSVVLMTVHSSKGLEFPVVFLPGFENGLFPGLRSIDNPKEMEEERRLAYVAVTRAKEALCITHVRQRLIYGQTSFNQISRFADEIDKKYLDIKDAPTHKPGAAVRINRAQSAAMNARSEMEKAYPRKSVGQGQIFTAGDRVRHATFGEGMVVTVKQMGGDTLYEVAFDSVGTKKMMGSYAKLRKIGS